jgi:hypothetical protein
VEQQWARQETSGLIGQSQIDPDRTRITVTVQADGTADWELALWTRLDSNEAESAFRSLEDDIQSDPATVLDQFESRMIDTVAAAADATGRDMTAGSFTVRTETRAIPQQYGLLVYQFVWEGFAEVDGAGLRAGDAIDGLLLESGTRLTIRWPDRFDLKTVDPPPDEEGEAVVAWSGAETDFLSGQPRVVVSDGANSQSGSTNWPLIGGGLVGTLGVVGVLWWVRRRGDGFSTSDDRAAEPPASVDDEPAQGAAATQPSDNSENGEKSTSQPPAELLTNEERVLQLLEEHGGRIKQQQVVAELDWTEAKTSQVVTSLREEEQIEVLRIGRENVLALPDEASI